MKKFQFNVNIKLFFIKLFQSLINWPSANIDDLIAIKEVKRFMKFGQFALIIHADHYVGNGRSTLIFDLTSIAIDYICFLTVGRWFICHFVSNYWYLGLFGDWFEGTYNELGLRLLGIVGFGCLWAFRAYCCFKVRRKSFQWITLIDKIVRSESFHPTVLNLTPTQCVRFKQILVFNSRQYLSFTVINSLIYIIFGIYLMISSPLFGKALFSNDYLLISAHIFWTTIAIIGAFFVTIGSLWIGVLIILIIFYYVSRIDLLNLIIEETIGEISKGENILQEINIYNLKLLNQLDSINRSLSHIHYIVYYVISFIGNAGFLLSCFHVFNFPLVDYGLRIVSLHDMSIITCSIFLAARVIKKAEKVYHKYHWLILSTSPVTLSTKVKSMVILDRLLDFQIGIRIGEIAFIDNQFLLMFILETCSTMMLLIVNLRTLIH